jgi:hypothetical protein
MLPHKEEKDREETQKEARNQEEENTSCLDRFCRARDGSHQKGAAPTINKGKKAEKSRNETQQDATNQEEKITSCLDRLLSCICGAKDGPRQKRADKGKKKSPSDKGKKRNESKTRYMTTVHSLDDSFYARDDKESDVQISVNQVMDLIRKGNNEVITLMRNANNEVYDFIQHGIETREGMDVTYVVQNAPRNPQDQSQQFPEVGVT